MTSARFAALWCSTVLASCASFHLHSLDVPALVQSFEARTLQNIDLRRYVASHLGSNVAEGSIKNWNFATLTLAAFYFSPDLDVARAKSVARDAAIQTAARRPNPSLQIPLIYTSNPKSGEPPYTLGLGFDIPIETAGKRGYRTEQARLLSVAGLFDVGNVAWQVRSRLRAQLLNLYVARRRAAVLEQLVQAQQGIVQMLDKRLSVGTASAPDVSRAHTTLNRARIDQANANQQIYDAQAGAAAVIGVPSGALDRVEISLDAFEVVHPALPDGAAREQAILNRADVLAALAEYEASQSALQLENANQYPDIHIGPGYTYDAGARKFALSLSGIALPLFDRNQGPIAEAEARRAEAAARVNAVQAQAIGDAERAARNYRSAVANLGLSDALLSTQEQQVSAVRKAFRIGETDRLSVALAEYEFQTAALARQDALAQVQRSIGRLEDAMQRPLSAGESTAESAAISDADGNMPSNGDPR